MAFRDLQRSVGQVKNVYIFEPGIQHNAGETGSAAANVNDCSTTSGVRGLDEVERNGRAIFKPADSTFILGDVHLVPIGFPGEAFMASPFIVRANRT